MSFKVVIETGNDAFMPDAAPELARLLRELADHVEDAGLPRYTEADGRLMDYNGNTVLRWGWEGRQHDDGEV